jgi:hypothetical protein
MKEYKMAGLVEHPGHGDQSVHGHRNTLNRISIGPETVAFHRNKGTRVYHTNLRKNTRRFTVLHKVGHTAGAHVPLIHQSGY